MTQEALRQWDPVPLTDTRIQNLGSYKHPVEKITRDKMREAGRCINGPRDLTLPADTPSKNGVVHGDVVSGGKCQRCLNVAKKSR